MIFLLIPIVWLALAAFVVVLCRMAARGDDALVAASLRPEPPVHRRVPLASRRAFRRPDAFGRSGSHRLAARG
ncbi:MAG TPA: hypothetical protein VGY13_07165 [Solirubrobacteraceae bacterium]|jgi:hypothetical protein|nr:hypothetical protein [Solirubrobacteraceae bacterium]